jgi:DNA-binding transcriptional MerR regulator
MQQHVKPAVVARQLGIADSTLRRYTVDFAAHLSSDAAPEAGTRRRFRPSDVAVLQRAKELLDAGNDIKQVNELLALDDFSTAEADQADQSPTGEQQASTALVSLLGAQLAGTQQDQSARITAQDARLAAVEGQLADLRVLVARLEAVVEALGSRLHDHPGIVPTRRR